MLEQELESECQPDGMGGGKKGNVIWRGLGVLLSPGSARSVCSIQSMKHELLAKVRERVGGVIISIIDHQAGYFSGVRER